ncbi:MAG: PAS domain-containing protein [Hyphomonadaceae bacterium]|nr:PAS domain-containing protein [Hyphomonadaceae bacterium]
MLDRTAHPNTRIMLEAWRRMDQAPVEEVSGNTGATEPSALIQNIFVLREAGPESWTFRTAGEAITTFFGKQISDEDFMDLWLGADRSLAGSVITAVTAEGGPGLIRARGETLTGRQLQVEIALAPLPSPPGTSRRLLGHYQPLGGEALATGPLWRHIITEIRAPQRTVKRPHLRLVSSND